VAIARVACDEVIISLVCFESLRLFVVVLVLESPPLHVTNDAPICSVDLNNCFFGYGFDGFCFNSSNLPLEVIYSTYFPSILLRLLVSGCEDELGVYY